MIEIKDGSELDNAVAEAIGPVFTHKINGSNVKCWSDPRSGLRRTFSPSTILQDAFCAVEVSCLFDVVRNGPEVHLAKTIDSQREILTGAVGLQSATVCGEMGYLTRESIPELAICAAILKLALR